MRILSVTLLNYRVHQKITVEFNLERTVIGGPNESGKSTLVEAIHRGLFLRAKVTGTALQAMKSIQGGGHPEVTLGFEIGGRNYQLHKRFSGTSGTTALTVSAGAALNGETAEEELGRLLSVPADANAKASLDHWAHLWVWQGRSGDDPADHANRQRDSLLQRLGETGGVAAIMQSEIDARVAKYFADSAAATFTQRDKAKADSDLARAEAEFSVATQEASAAKARLEKLSQSLQDYLTATSTLETLKSSLATLKAEKDAADFKEARVAELRRSEAAQSTETLAADATAKELLKVRDQCEGLQKNIIGARASLEPREKEIARLLEANEAAREEAEAALKVYDLASREVSIARQRHELATTQLNIFGQRQRRDELRARAGQVRELDESLIKLRADLAKLPVVETATLKQLEKFEREQNDSDATLRAMAAGIEVLSADQPVRMGDVALAPGQPQIVTAETEITIGAGVRLRIRPGGGTSLAEAQRSAQDSRAKLSKTLDTIGLVSVAAARESARQRADLATRIENATTRKIDLDAHALEQKLKNAEDDCLASEATIARRSASLAQSIENPTDETSARIEQKRSADQLSAAEDAEKKARAHRDTAAKIAGDVAQNLAQKRATIEQQKNVLTEYEAQLKLLVATHGDEVARSTRLNEANQSKTSADHALLEIRKTIANEQPEQLGPIQARLKRSLETIQTNQRDAENTKAVADHALRSDGSMDPEADLAIATAKLNSASDRLASVRRRAHAVRLLDELFREEQHLLADQFTRPLVEKASHYLRALYGPEARLDVTFSDREFSDLRLTRPQVASGSAVAFENLSGGTKEQVAVAMRLAMAEVLAANHHGNLPLVLDDAFVNADPERVRQLQHMLDLAATRGLQVIVVTCTPSDYTALGALHFQMPPVIDGSKPFKPATTNEH